MSPAYGAIADFYYYRGVASNVRPYLIAGIALLAVVTAWNVWTVADPGIVARDLHIGSSPPADILARIISPAGAIGLALIMLAWIERSVLLTVITAVYLLVVLTAARPPHLPLIPTTTTRSASGSVGLPAPRPDPRRRVAGRRHHRCADRTASRPDGHMTDHPVNDLDDVVHQRVRLGILAVTQQARRVEFNYLRTELNLTAGNLSQHLNVLERAGLITIDKGYDGKRPRTWLQLTSNGKKALHKEITTLQTLIRELETGGLTPRPHPRS